MVLQTLFEVSVGCWTFLHEIMFSFYDILEQILEVVWMLILTSVVIQRLVSIAAEVLVDDVEVENCAPKEESKGFDLHTKKCKVSEEEVYTENRRNDEKESVTPLLPQKDKRDVEEFVDSVLRSIVAEELRRAQNETGDIRNEAKCGLDDGDVNEFVDTLLRAIVAEEEQQAEYKNNDIRNEQNCDADDGDVNDFVDSLLREIMAEDVSRATDLHTEMKGDFCDPENLPEDKRDVKGAVHTVQLAMSNETHLLQCSDKEAETCGKKLWNNNENLGDLEQNIEALNSVQSSVREHKKLGDRQHPTQVEKQFKKVSLAEGDIVWPEMKRGVIASPGPVPTPSPKSENVPVEPCTSTCYKKTDGVFRRLGRRLRKRRSSIVSSDNLPSNNRPSRGSIWLCCWACHKND